MKSRTERVVPGPSTFNLNCTLSVVFDFRDYRLNDVVILAKNENSRLPLINKQFSKENNIVVLDGGSDNDFLDYCLSNRITVFSRVGEENIGENFFVYYCNFICHTKCFYMCADEFITTQDLRLLFSNTDGDTGGAVNKIEWIYGKPCSDRQNRHYMPRCFTKGTASFDRTNLHNSLRFSSSITKAVVANLHHVHLRSVRAEYGKFGRYIASETSHANQLSTYRFIRRYFIPILTYILLRFLRDDLGLWRSIYRVQEMFVHLNIAILSLIEKRINFPEKSQRDVLIDLYEVNSSMIDSSSDREA